MFPLNVYHLAISTSLHVSTNILSLYQSPLISYTPYCKELLRLNSINSTLRNFLKIIYGNHHNTLWTSLTKEFYLSKKWLIYHTHTFQHVSQMLEIFYNFQEKQRKGWTTLFSGQFPPTLFHPQTTPRTITDLDNFSWTITPSHDNYPSEHCPNQKIWTCPGWALSRRKLSEMGIVWEPGGLHPNKTKMKVNPDK